MATPTKKPAAQLVRYASTPSPSSGFAGLSAASALQTQYRPQTTAQPSTNPFRVPTQPTRTVTAFNNATGARVSNPNVQVGGVSTVWTTPRGAQPGWTPRPLNTPTSGSLTPNNIMPGPGGSMLYNIPGDPRHGQPINFSDPEISKQFPFIDAKTNFGLGMIGQRAEIRKGLYAADAAEAAAGDSDDAAQRAWSYQNQLREKQARDVQRDFQKQQLQNAIARAGEDYAHDRPIKLQKIDDQMASLGLFDSGQRDKNRREFTYDYDNSYNRNVSDWNAEIANIAALAALDIVTMAPGGSSRSSSAARRAAAQEAYAILEDGGDIFDLLYGAIGNWTPETNSILNPVQFGGTAAAPRKPTATTTKPPASIPIGAAARDLRPWPTSTPKKR